MRNPSISTRLLPALLHLLILTFTLPHLTTAHMAMSEPPALRYKTNPYKTTEDYDYTSPLSSSGSNFPCKGYHKDLGTPGGRSVRTYAPGGTYKLQFAGSATHAGGSCQLSLSYDGGQTWEVFKSFIGGCVKPDPSSDQTFSFTIPGGARGGEALFAWTWFNNLGNREMYMNCAVVTISGNGGGSGDSGSIDRTTNNNSPLIYDNQGIGKRTPVAEAPVAVLQRRDWGGPSLFIANIGNGCTVPAGKDVLFPNPGNDVTYGGNEANRAKPEGNCGSGNYRGSGGRGGAAVGRVYGGTAAVVGVVLALTVLCGWV